MNSDRHVRRARLSIAANPDARYDYLIRLAGSLPDGTGMTVRYVPDRLVLDPRAFAAYLSALPPNGLEQLALTVLDDLNNELIPRWLQVIAHRNGTARHDVVIEDRQPAWDNPGLIARLAPL